MCRDRELLVAVVASEEAMVEHQVSCGLCRDGLSSTCREYVELVILGAEHMIAAKIWLDGSEGCSLEEASVA